MVSSWQWENVPIPEVHVLAVLLTELLHRIVPWKMHRANWSSTALGCALVVGSIVLGGWAVRTAGHESLDRPSTLVSNGPYAYSRNPMYVAWTLLIIGIAVVRNTIWLLASVPFVVIATHWIIRREERELEERFGETYRCYMKSVPRYL